MKMGSGVLRMRRGLAKAILKQQREDKMKRNKASFRFDVCHDYGLADKYAVRFGRQLGVMKRGGKTSVLDRFVLDIRRFKMANEKDRIFGARGVSLTLDGIKSVKSIIEQLIGKWDELSKLAPKGVSDEIRQDCQTQSGGNSQTAGECVAQA